MTLPLAPATQPNTWRTDRLADSILLLLAMTVVQRMIGFLRGVMFCRWLDPLDLGQWDMAFGFIELAAPVMMLGLPGSFGRYVEYYREQGQLSIYLRRTAALTTAAALVMIGCVICGHRWTSLLVFGSPNQSELVRLIAFGLGAVGFYFYVNTLLTALRRNRVVSSLEFINSVLFATLATSLLLGWRANAASVVIAYSVACLISGTLALICLRPILGQIPASTTELSHGALWRKLLPFAMCVWGTNWLANLFELADRYMLVHFGNDGPTQALVDVGNYHSSRIVPLLLVSVTGLLGTVMTPYLSHEWETQGSSAVSRRMNLTLKLLGICLLVGGAAILSAAPLLFAVAFRGKFASGMTVLPWTLTYCIWFGMARVAQKYLWCAERVRLAALAWLLGLGINIGLNLLLLPLFGLVGVVVSTAAGNLASLMMLYAMNRLQGMRVDRGTWLLSATPALLVFGSSAAWLGCLLIVFAALRGDWLLDPSERQQLLAVWNDYLVRLRSHRQARPPTILKEVT